MADRKELQATAEEAIGLAKQMCGVDLDYSLGSIGTLDAVLGTVYNQKEELEWDEDMLWGLAFKFGPYYGELMLRNEFEDLGFVWGEDPDGEPTLVNDSHKEGFSLGVIRPINKCAKRMLFGPEDILSHYYATCMAMAQM